jgi:hypothetical protein
LSLSGGLLLAVCFFLPAVKGCNQPVYPYEVPQVGAPYLLGLAGAVVSAVLLRRRRLSRALRRGHMILSVAGAAAIGIASHLLLSDIKLAEASEDSLRVLAAVAMWWAVAVAMAPALRRGCEPRWRTHRLLACTGAMSAAWFLCFARMEDAYYGLWLSLLGSELMAAGGLMAQRADSVPQL